MWLMLKLSIASTILLSSISLQANDKQILDFEKDRLSKNTKLKIKEVKINLKQKTSVKNWDAYVFNIKADFSGKQVDAKDILFSDGKVVAADLFFITNGASLKDEITPKLSTKYYESEKLIAGNKNAKHSLVVFSDPFCPFCMDYVPEVIKFVKKNPKDLKLYYYHYPLEQIHPAAATVAKAMTALKLSNKMEDVEIKFYEADFEKYFNESDTNETKILDGINKVLKTKLTLKDIKNQAVVDELTKDIKLGDDAMVPGTPAIFVNGQADKTKRLYETLVK